MNIHFKNPPEGLSEKLIERAEKNINKLSKFVHERNYEAQIFVDIHKESSDHSSNKKWQTSIHLDLAGERFNAEETADTAEKATDKAITELGGELRKAHAKSRSVSKREGGMFKRLMRGFK